MGVLYYLWRDDNKTAYELGKSWTWGEIFGCPRHTSVGTPMILKPEDAPELAELLRMHLVEHEHSLAVEFGHEPRQVASLDYLAFVTADIARWSEGQPFEFISEHDHRYEAACMEGYPNFTNRQFRTGSRFDAWLERGPRCECEEPTTADGFSRVAYCTTCGRYKMCPVCGEHAAVGQVACEKHVHRVRKGGS